jgi:leucyl/phenylalanyl-tRNA--protein transferase
MRSADAPLTWVEPGQNFPPLEQAWGDGSPAPGLLCAGQELNAERLQEAYWRGIFPWFSPGQPVLWWSPDPRMVLTVAHFKLSPSLKKVIQQFKRTAGCEVRFDSQFEAVMRACAAASRPRQSGTWIVPAMVQAYTDLHVRGWAHSVETWIDGELVGGLYCVAIGQAVFGESMFFKHSNASKIALAALVAWCRAQGVVQIDCQQATPHLASLGAGTVPRSTFIHLMQEQARKPAPAWQFDPVYWDHVLA